MLATLGLPFGLAQGESSLELYPEVQEYVEESASQFDRIPDERKKELKKIALYIRTHVSSGQPANLTFICTHNSRRSHMSQIWAQVAAAFYGVSHVTTYSGGIESTAFNPRAVAAIERAGLEVEKTNDGANPIYHVRYSPTAAPMTHFSKVYNDAPNPKEGFVAVMTCSSADKNCPTVEGSSLRAAIPYEDPKASDGTDKESSAYDERCRQISRELMYLMSQVKE
jgi:protein-tyrosine-phosphatase